ncbi:TPA: conjugal transfer protein TraF [Vibrio cholerae]|uniref:conjugal transfer protein TraF n=1 Tax=Vibrio anguillarum TaxID=55601 RepID=UPI0002FEBAB7|nr:conjugal transfer protein TraF [Vibrio anguillarum]
MNMKIILLAFLASFISISASAEESAQFNIGDFKFALDQAKDNAMSNPTTENVSWYHKLATLSVDYSAAIATNDDVETIRKQMAEAISKSKSE